MTTHNLRIALDGVVQLLSRNLYEHPDAFLREMIQNAHDSIVKRRRLEPLQGRIQILPDPVRRTITITDDGVGLTRQEIHDHLSTIGRSGTGELRATLAGGDPVQLIGRFGIGLLAAFLVAHRVEVHTQSLVKQESWHWIFDGGSSYDLFPGDRKRPGTEVTLHLNPSALQYLDRGRLEELVRRFADLLPVPITIGAELRASNAQRAPWEQDTNPEGVRSFLTRRFPALDPLLVLSVDEEVLGGRVQGVLGIGRDADARGRLDLYVRRMFVTSAQVGLLPTWAGFVSGVVQCDALTPVAARDRVLADGVLDAVQTALGAALLRHLHQLAQTEPQTLTALIRVHRRSLLAILCEPDQDELFAQLADLVPLRSSHGLLTIEQLVARNPAGIHLRFITQRNGSAPLQMLCEASAMPVLQLDEAYAEPFMRRYSLRWPAQLQLVRIDASGGGGLIEPVSAEQRFACRALCTAFSRMVAPDGVEVARFAPPELPLIRLETATGRGQREVRELVEHIGVPAFLDKAMAWAREPAKQGAVLYLNLNNTLIQRLVADPGQPSVSQVVAVLVDQARLAAGVRLSASEHLAVLQRASKALEGLL